MSRFFYQTATIQYPWGYSCHMRFEFELPNLCSLPFGLLSWCDKLFCHFYHLHLHQREVMKHYEQLQSTQDTLLLPSYWSNWGSFRVFSIHWGSNEVMEWVLDTTLLSLASFCRLDVLAFHPSLEPLVPHCVSSCNALSIHLLSSQHRRTYKRG